MTIQSACCGCHVINDYGTSIVEGDGSQSNPYAVRQVDPLFERPIVKIRKEIDTIQTIPNNTDTPITFEEVLFDTDNMFDNTNSTRLTVPISGLYMMGADVAWEIVGGDPYETFFRLNGSIELDRQVAFNASVTAEHFQNMQYLWFFAAGDYVELVAFQLSGGNRDINSSATLPTHFWMMYMGVKI